MLALRCMLSSQVDERKLVRVWCMEKLLRSQLVPGTNKQFLGLVLTAARLLEPAKSVIQANHQHGVVWKTFACSYCIAGAL
jgi:hypothetical protein